MSYEGDPLDYSWNNGPWDRDGETISASDDNMSDPKIETVDWPEAATPEDELNDKQIGVIKAAVRYPNVESSMRLVELAGLDEVVSQSYASSVLIRHWPARYWAGENDPEVDTTTQPSGTANGKKHSESERALTKQMRELALGGMGRKEIAEKYDRKPKTVGRRLRGDAVDVESPPPLTFDQSRQRYVPQDDAPTQTELTNSGTDFDPDTEPVAVQVESSRDSDGENTTHARGIDYGKIAIVLWVGHILVALVRLFGGRE